ncbi:metal-dependent hydrolase [Haloprofundus sp. MHR1]|uniref:metal-dependent hydrolase n=1 Tax=Haloprofundus sp. MHR1 TaxID=2572921 RepID=UPI0010BE4573|nr:metal-dependent hydrolase [Haloprofundus sp. MHR1]QCJ47428.1 metal-dependent hydrolase [Haloprofundus sp. MHR1]
MWPWGHLAFGYVWYSVWSRTTTREPPTEVSTLAVVLGTQFPDLVDKPLAWVFGLLPSGRSLAHSVLTMALVVGVLYFLARKYRRTDLVTAFGIGYASHLVGDSLSALFDAEYGELAFLLYPLMYTDYGEEYGFLYRLAQLDIGDFLGPQFLVVLAVVVLWIIDGAPGPGALGSLLKRAYDRLAGTSQSESEHGG